VVVGSPSANRKAETEPLIGPFSAPIALRLNLAGSPTLRDVLKAATQATLDALDHAELPFEVLFKHLDTRAVHGRNPLFQFYFLYQTAFLQPHKMPGLSVTPLPTVALGTPFELQLAVIERPERVNANLEYNSSLFDDETIREVLLYYQLVLEAFTSNPDQLVEELTQPAGARSGHAVNETGQEIAQYAAPSGPTEELLTQIWQRIFKLPRIGIRDDFFALVGTP